MEPDIVMNGRQLCSAEAMVIRVAVESFAQSLADDGLGDDKHGKAMVKLYFQNIRTIREKMYKL